MIALLLVLLGTFGITAWFGLIAARSLEVGAKEEAMIRRVQLNGVKEVTRQLGSQSFLAFDGGKTGNTDIQLSTSYGKVTTPPWTGTPYTNTSLLRYDQVGGIPGKSFSIDLLALLDDGQGALGAVEYNLQLRSYVPAQRGDLLTIHEPVVATTPVVTDTGLMVNGRTVVWDGSNALAHRTERLHTSAKASTVSLTNLSGTAILPDNETFAPRSTGSDFIGRLKAINSSESNANRYSSRLSALGAAAVAVDGSVASGDKSTLGYDSDGSGKVYIELDHPLLPHLLITDVSEIELLGQNGSADFATAGSLEPRLIVCVQPSAGVWGALTILAKHENNRAIVVAVRQEVPRRQSPLVGKIRCRRFRVGAASWSLKTVRW